MSHLTPHESISDAAIRIIHGIDDNNPITLASAFTDTAVQDLTSFKFLAPYFGMLNGREEIVEMVLGTVGKMDTTHMLSNFRSEVIGQEGKRGKMSCYALAQHWRPGQGRSWAFGGGFLMGNRYEGDLVFDGEVWRFERFRIQVVWTQGDFGVFDQDSWEVVRQGVREGIEKGDEA